MQKIKNIILDYGNVIFMIDFQRLKQAFTDLGIPNVDDVFAHSGQIALFDDFDKGRIGKDGVYIGDNFYYIKEKGQVKIKFNDGRIYKKKDGKWEEVEDEN